MQLQGQTRLRQSFPMVAKPRLSVRPRVLRVILPHTIVKITLIWILSVKAPAIFLPRLLSAPTAARRRRRNGAVTPMADKSAMPVVSNLSSFVTALIIRFYDPRPSPNTCGA